jgi:hypothetical protein
MAKSLAFGEARFATKFSHVQHEARGLVATYGVLLQLLGKKIEFACSRATTLLAMRARFLRKGTGSLATRRSF